ncbi:MAG: M48 family metallopeptidase [Proteobacteria bacterium]|nr:M48 family metallopeptidase [Pseudomonadota bacterium]MCP4919372.1 M48 family metallopeptidase [Pseudomonadota bacterium]
MHRQTLSNLTEDDFIHPLDAEAMDVLKSFPGFDKMVAQLMEHGLEKILALEQTGMSVKVGPRQLPELWERYLRVCEVLNVEPPGLYVKNDPTPNAYTFGEAAPFIVITSGLLELMDPMEVDFVIGHELGHVKCHHVLYRVVAENMKLMLSIVGEVTMNIGQVVGMGLAIPLYDWYRKAELSGDRCGLLAVQDPEVALGSMMKMAAGTRKMAEQLDLTAFMAQAREYDEVSEVDDSAKLYKFLLTAWRTHPMTVMRAKHLDAWIRSGGYQVAVGGKPLPVVMDEPQKTL